MFINKKENENYFAYVRERNLQIADMARKTKNRKEIADLFGLTVFTINKIAKEYCKFLFPFKNHLPEQCRGYYCTDHNSNVDYKVSNYFK